VRVLALDFDGVLFHTAREAALVALRVYLEMRPDSRLRSQAERVASTLADPTRDILDDPLVASFVTLMALGNRAEDFGVALSAIDAGVTLDHQGAYDAFYATHSRVWRDAFHARLYQVRAAFAASDEATWLRLQPPYPGIAELLRRHAHEIRLALATAKDRDSVRRLLSHHGMADLFTEDLVLDKEAGLAKTAHLALIQTRTGASYQDITFVDDKLNHLASVAPLGVRCVLAAWGYNGERERALARAAGFAVCTIGGLERLLSG
jgi:phosphoglycolate phosphatase-like HAD superfamily hydrolase